MAETAKPPLLIWFRNTCTTLNPLTEFFCRQRAENFFSAADLFHQPSPPATFGQRTWSVYTVISDSVNVC
jgi:hypothetical protein